MNATKLAIIALVFCACADDVTDADAVLLHADWPHLYWSVRDGLHRMPGGGGPAELLANSSPISSGIPGGSEIASNFFRADRDHLV